MARPPDGIEEEVEMHRTPVLAPLVTGILLAACTGTPTGSDSGGRKCTGEGPGTVDACDGVDNDCDGEVDEDAQFSTWYPDSDGDGYGSDDGAISSCSEVSGAVQVGGDCDDTNSAVHPAATEICDGADNDCDGKIDAADESITGTLSAYQDEDGDGYGSGPGFDVCELPAGYASQDGDCDDTNSAANPGATETCGDGIDNDCDGTTNGCVAWTGSIYRTDANTVFSGSDSSFGNRIAGADLDGDGVNELVIADEQLNRSGSGGIAVFDAPEAGFTYDLSNATGIRGVDSGEYAGLQMAAGADLTGDGYGDVFELDSTGSVSIYTGPFNGWRSTSSADGYLRSVVTSATSTAYAHLLSAGDVDGDGQADLAVGSPYQSTTTYADGLVYVFSGPLTTLADAGNASTVIYGDESQSSYAGWAVQGEADVSGDGVNDLVMTAIYADSDNGALYVFTDVAAQPSSVFDADLIVSGDYPGGYLGVALDTRGDMDGDGIDDIVASAIYDKSSGYGSVFVLPGTATGKADATSLAMAEIIGSTHDTYGLGRSLGSASDLDGDGAEDLAIDSQGYDVNASYTGAVYLFYGPLSGTYKATNADATITGVSDYEYFGHTTATVGDVNGDGFDDLAVGGIGMSEVDLFLGGGL